MRLWQVTGLLALLCAFFLIATAVREPDTLIGPNGFGGLVGLVALGVPTLLLHWAAARDRRIDRSGPVSPSEDPTVADGGRWTLDQIAAVLALHVEPMNGLVFADPRSGTLRVMIDPPSAITWSPAKTEQTNFTSSQRERWQRQGGRSETPAHYTGRWTSIRLRPGRLPQVKNQKWSVSVRTGADGVLIPLWSADGDSGRNGSGALTRARSRTPISLEFDSRELTRAIDRIAVRAGWVAESRAARRQPATGRNHETRTVDRTGTESTTRTWTTSDGTSTSTMTFTTSDPEQAENLPTSAAEARARFEEIRRDNAASMQTETVKIFKVMAVIGGSILLGCVIGTALGLIFGMPWWASFIIIGSGLLFCLLFVLPVWLLAGRPLPSKSS